jgi:hypothetical protein
VKSAKHVNAHDTTADVMEEPRRDQRIVSHANLRAGEMLLSSRWLMTWAFRRTQTVVAHQRSHACQMLDSIPLVSSQRSITRESRGTQMIVAHQHLRGIDKGVYRTYKTYEPSTKATFQPPASLSLSSSPNSLTMRCSKLSIS